MLSACRDLQIFWFYIKEDELGLVVVDIYCTVSGVGNNLQNCRYSTEEKEFWWKKLPKFLSLKIVFYFHFLHPEIIQLSDVLAVYKLQDDTPLVGAEYAKPNVVYLFQFPRTELTPSQAALCLMVETWAHWNRNKVSFRVGFFCSHFNSLFLCILFKRISNKFFLGSKTEGTAPFAQINGKFVDGSENIISALANKFEIDVKMNREQKEVKELCENVLFR